MKVEILQQSKEITINPQTTYFIMYIWVGYIWDMHACMCVCTYAWDRHVCMCVYVMHLPLHAHAEARTWYWYLFLSFSTLFPCDMMPYWTWRSLCLPARLSASSMIPLCPFIQHWSHSCGKQWLTFSGVLGIPLVVHPSIKSLLSLFPLPLCLTLDPRWAAEIYSFHVLFCFS